MQISRHAKNNMRLYGIEEDDINLAIQAPDRMELEGRYHVVYKTFPNRFGTKPLKVVYLIEGDTAVLVTAYPLRRQQWR